ncbi:glycoside hydrolase family 76 protein [Amycolatopsis jejuensis]|uniref:glycoside hydrolase family 76 protein n=1 Tax=Amycolatopsis jejuensis TaxID=330084 RepID=UPI001FDF26C2|nr:glycoside hydrolase family 76 protein [Amycolatopsis jejuensis]
MRTMVVVLLALAFLTVPRAPARADTTVCVVSCDRLDPSRAAQESFPLPDKGINGRVVRLHVSDPDGMAWASIDNGHTGDAVWLDRSWDGGATWDGLLGKASIPGTWTGTRTLMYNITDPVGHRRGLIRACGDAQGVGCTGWIYPTVCDTTCDGVPPGTGDSQPVPSATIFGRTIRLHFDDRGMAWAGIDEGSTGDEVWLDRSWDAGSTWPGGSSLGRTSVPSAARAVAPTGEGAGVETGAATGAVVPAARGAGVGTGAATGTVASAVRGAGVGTGAAISTVVPEASDASIETGAATRTVVPAARGAGVGTGAAIGAVVSAARGAGVETGAATRALVPAARGAGVGTGAATGTVASAARGVSVQTGAAARAVVPAARAESVPTTAATPTVAPAATGAGVLTTAATSARTPAFATKDPRGRMFGGAVRACGREASHQQGACTAWARPAQSRVAAAADALLWSHDTYRAWWASSWWNSAVAVTALADSGLPGLDPVLARVFDVNRAAFPAGERSSDPIEGDFVSRAIDDSAWWGLAWIAAYDRTHESRYLTEATTIADYVRGFWDPGTCGGGVWWDRERTYKNAVTSGLYLRLTAALHRRIGGDTTWGDRAREAGDWYLRSGLINSAGLVNDGLTSGCANNGQTVWTYNQGLAIGGFTELWRATGEQSYLDTARRLADAAMSGLTSGGIVTESCDSGTCDDNQKQFKGIFLRYFGDLADATGAYGDFVRRQADSIWNNDRDSLNRIGQRWSGGTPNVVDWRTQASGLEALIAAHQ